MNADNLDIRLLRYRSRRDESPHVLANLLLEAKRPSEALEVVRLAQGDTPDAELMVLEGRAWFDQAALPEAQEALMRAVKTDPRSKEPYRWLAQVLMKRGEPGRAVQVLERALHIDGADRTLQQAHMRAQRLARIANDTELIGEGTLVAPVVPPPADPFLDGQAHTLRPATQAQNALPARAAPDGSLPSAAQEVRIEQRARGPEPRAQSRSPFQPKAVAAVVSSDFAADDAPTAAFEMPDEIRNWLEAERTQSMPTQPPAPLEAIPSPVFALSRAKDSSVSEPDFEAALAYDSDGSLELHDVRDVAPPAEAEAPERVLEVLSQHGVFESKSAAGAGVDWAAKGEAKGAGQRVGTSLAVGWVLALAAAGGGYFGFNHWLEGRRADAQTLIAKAMEAAADGQHASLVSAERQLLEARALDPKSIPAIADLLFVQATRALEDASSEVSYLRSTLASAESAGVSPSLVAAAKALVSAVDGDLGKSQALAASALEKGKDDPRVLYLVGRLYQRTARVEARALLQQASTQDPSFALAFAAEAEIALAEQDHEGARALLQKALGKDAQFLRAELWQMVLDVTGESAPALDERLEALSERITQGSAADQLLAIIVGSRVARAQEKMDSARSTLEKAKTLTVLDPELMSLLGQEALATGTLELAYRAANTAVKAAPAVQRYREELVQVLLARGDGRTALRSMDGIASDDGSFGMYAEARAALLSGSREALAETKKRLAAYRATTAGRGDVEASALLLRADLKLGANAESLLPTARTLAHGNPSSALAQLALGEAALHSGQGELALKALAKAVAVSPNDADGYYLRGRAQRLVSRPQEAKEDFLKALSLAPEHAQAREALGGLLVDSGQYDEALSVFGKLEQAGRGLSGTLGMVEALMGSGDLVAAETKFNRLSDAERALAASSVVAARLSIANHKPADAVARLAPLVAKDADTRSAEVLSLYGEALYADDKVDSAAGAFEAALEFDATYPEALIGRAMTAARAEKAKDAKSYLASANKALETRVRPPKLRAVYLVTLAKAHILDQEWEQAKQRLVDAIAIPGVPVEGHFWLGEMLTKTKSSKASDSYAKYLELAPNGSYATRAKRALAPR